MHCILKIQWPYNDFYKPWFFNPPLWLLERIENLACKDFDLHVNLVCTGLLNMNGFSQLLTLCNTIFSLSKGFNMKFPNAKFFKTDQFLRSSRQKRLIKPSIFCLQSVGQWLLFCICVPIYKMVDEVGTFYHELFSQHFYYIAFKLHYSNIRLQRSIFFWSSWFHFFQFFTQVSCIWNYVISVIWGKTDLGKGRLCKHFSMACCQLF